MRKATLTALVCLFFALGCGGIKDKGKNADKDKPQPAPKQALLQRAPGV